MNFHLKNIRKNTYALVGLFALVVIGVTLIARVQNMIVPARLHFAWQVITGLLLLATIVYQWLLMRKRWIRAASRADLVSHRWLGVLATFLFAVHAVRIGHTWMLILTMVFVVVALTGVFNKEFLGFRSRWAYLTWFTIHVGFSAILAPMIAVHIWVALAYQ